MSFCFKLSKMLDELRRPFLFLSKLQKSKFSRFLSLSFSTLANESNHKHTTHTHNSCLATIFVTIFRERIVWALFLFDLFLFLRILYLTLLMMIREANLTPPPISVRSPLPPDLSCTSKGIFTTDTNQKKNKINEIKRRNDDESGKEQK